jgi:hypothetical protein
LKVVMTLRAGLDTAGRARSRRGGALLLTCRMGRLVIHEGTVRGNG